MVCSDKENMYIYIHMKIWEYDDQPSISMEMVNGSG